ncbi:MAG: hypothetical protein ABR591_02815 [Candidatus Velthaea sp.]
MTGLNAGSNSIQPGRMLIRFRTVLPQDYTTFRYVIVFNTSGNGQEPFPQAFQTGFLNFSFAFVVGGPAGALAQPQLLQYFLAPGTSSGIQTFNIVVPIQLAQVVPNTGGSQFGEFTLSFDRTLLFGVNPGGTPVPLPSATGGNPNVQPTTLAQHVWNINFITTDASGTPIDSAGIGGNVDNTFQQQIDTTQFIDQTFTKPQTAQVTSGAAQIRGYEIINAP